MTREEAIKIIEFVRNNALDYKLDKALDMAIEALSAEPCEDCISRAEAHKHIYQRLWESALNNVGYECKTEDVFMDIADNRLRTWVSEIPSIQSKWISSDDFIKSLEAEYYENCISREEVCDYIAEFVNHEYATDREREMVEYIIDGIQHLPSIQPKTGHWVHGEYCSECGCDVPAYISDWKWQKDMDAKYCPNCGAKMEEYEET